MSVMIVGDVHTRFAPLNRVIDEFKPDIILQCGELGYWPRYSQYDFSNINNGDTKIYFADGNHDDHDALNKLTNNEVSPNIFFMKRGSTLVLPDGRKVLFMGGADSIDKHLRTVGVDWYAEEIISQKDLDALPDPAEFQPDIVISHTAPLAIVKKIDKITGFVPKYTDPSEHALTIVQEMYKPKQWFLGHFHMRHSFKYKGTQFEVLSMAMSQDNTHDWYMFLD